MGKKKTPTGDFFMDADGIMRRYMSKVHDRAAEVKRISEADESGEQAGKTWMIINKAWLYGWLRFVRDETNAAHAPGPVSNLDLIRLSWDMDRSVFEDSEIRARNGLDGLPAPMPPAA